MKKRMEMGMEYIGGGVRGKLGKCTEEKEERRVVLVVAFR
jgi:hypothetical protein